MNNENQNNFLVKFYEGDNLLLDISVRHWNEYIKALEICNKITIKDREYSIKDKNMVHANYNDGKGMVIELHVTVHPVKERNTKLSIGKGITR